MEQKQILRQMLAFNQATFNNSFNAVVLLQDQFERVAQTAIDQANWLPAEGHKAIENWVAAYKTGRDNYKKYMDESYQKAEQIFAG